MHYCGTGSFRFVYISLRSEVRARFNKCETRYAHESDVLTSSVIGLLNMKVTYKIKYLKTSRVNKTLFDRNFKHF